MLVNKILDSDPELREKNLHKAYFYLFMDPATNDFTPGAKMVIADLYDRSGVGESQLPRNADGTINNEEVLVREGRRQMFLGIMRRIFKQPRINNTEQEPNEFDMLSSAMGLLREELQ